MASIALENPLPCQVGAFFCQASMQDADLWFGSCMNEHIVGHMKASLQRLMVKDVKVCQYLSENCMLSPAGLASAARLSGRAARCVALTSTSPNVALCLGRRQAKMVP